MFRRRKPDGAEGQQPAPDDAKGGPATFLVQPGGDALAASRMPSRPVDTGLGVPPFRPVPPKEVPAMSRPPMPMPAPLPPGGSAMPPSAGRIGQAPRPARETAERRTLVVGRGISVQGTVQDAERLVVEGTVEATMITADELSVAQGGIFRGEVEVGDAEVAGTIDGTLTVRGNLVVRATGKVLGTARCRRLQVEDGGAITGRIEMLTDASDTQRSEAPRVPVQAENAA